MKKRWWIMLTLGWLAVVIAGLVVVLIHANTAGTVGETPDSWPTGSTIPRSKDKPTLVMFAHPQCVCTRASVGELAELMTHCQGKVDARVVFYAPKEEGRDWVQTDTWRSAAAIPGVTVLADEDGREAQDFHAETSGQTVLYDTEGRLIFSGGITEARGHSGDNDGLSAIETLLNQGGKKRGAVVPKTPVFGCPILEEPERTPAQGS